MKANPIADPYQDSVGAKETRVERRTLKGR
jgi:hypothetical protein